MPIIIVKMWPGRDLNTKRRIVEGITNILEKEKVPRDAITIVIEEIVKENWATAGVLAAD